MGTWSSWVVWDSYPSSGKKCFEWYTKKDATGGTAKSSLRIDGGTIYSTTTGNSSSDVGKVTVSRWNQDSGTVGTVYVDNIIVDNTGWIGCP